MTGPRGTVSMAIKGRLYPSRVQAETLTHMRYVLACIRERVKAESREYYELRHESCPPDWLQKTIAQPMHNALGMPCDAQSVVNVVQTQYRALRNFWKRPDHFNPPRRRAPERCPANIYVHNQMFNADGFDRKTKIWTPPKASGGIRVRLGKVSWIKWRAGRLPTGKIMSGCVSYRGGHWYLSIHYEGLAPAYAEPRTKAVGIDPGIRAMMAHDGERSMEFARVPERSKSRRQRLDRKISRAGWRCEDHGAVLSAGDIATLRNQKRRRADCGCWIGQYRPGRRYRKLTATQAKLKKREANMRRDRSHKVTRELIDDARIIGYEDPSAQAWQESKMFGEASREAAAGEFARQLRYKGGWAGRDVVAVPESAASTQTCYACGERTPHKLGLKEFRCDSCGHTDQRDVNAAKNVRRIAIEGARAAPPEAVG